MEGARCVTSWGKPVPDVPFPRVSETDVLDKKLGVIFQRSMRGVKKVTLVAHHCWLSGWLGGSSLGRGCEGRAWLSSGLNLGRTKKTPNGPNITDIIYFLLLLLSCIFLRQKYEELTIRISISCHQGLGRTSSRSFRMDR